ncbi:MAG: HD domain-containing protein [Deltaproteobacteria bacterium]|nr:HD domain-containing protein [Deltaproteobacteria bacterium]
MTGPSKDELAQALQGVLRIRPQLDIIMRLCTFVESREEASGLHIYRLTAYALQIATQLDLTVQARERLALATPLHDVGKLLIPGHILLKPGKLDPEEWEIMKMHTISGSRLLEGSSFDEVEQAAQVALCHHEKWDGSGYPNGLVEDSIPLPARIVAVADVFDALTTKRSYKNAYPLDTALDMVKEGAGTHFDPEVVEAFLAAESRISHLHGLFDEARDEIPLYRFAEFLEGRR